MVVVMRYSVGHIRLAATPQACAIAAHACGVDFEVNTGEVVGLLGPNGAGKTTSFRMATGQITPNAGTVWFNGEEVTALPMYQRARRGMGYLPQEHSIFRKLTAEQNIL